jgi:hypothetical protein
MSVKDFMNTYELSDYYIFDIEECVKEWRKENDI